ncbi:MAG: peptidylprolyl isomerase [Deltaproteobacteria bacterium]|nr:peptidylprolyl isomerase [Deltaproteobacteria bacterium]
MVSLSWKQKTASVLAATGLLWALAAPGWAEEKADAGTVIADGKQISLEFTLSLEDKTQVQSNIGQEPMVYVHGTRQIIPGLEKQLTGLKVGDTKHVELSPEDGYGPKDPARTQEVEKDKIPEEARKVGSKLTGQGPQGQPMYAEVKEVKEKTLVLDLNHPLAGKKLIFDIKVLKVENAPPPPATPTEGPGATPGAPEAKPADAAPTPTPEPKKAE